MREQTAAARFENLMSEVLAMVPDDYARGLLERFRASVALMPMEVVLNKIPGETTVAKCRKLGVSQVTWWKWRTGKTRPTAKQAKLIAELSGVPAAKFQGRR